MQSEQGKWYDDVRIVYDYVEYEKTKEYTFKIYTNLKEYNRISAHRFVQLCDVGDYVNHADVILQSLSRGVFKDNEFIRCGRELEPIIEKHVTETYGLVKPTNNRITEWIGDENFNGKVDMYYGEVIDTDLPFEIPTNVQNQIGEIKTYYSERKIKGGDLNPNIEWWLQLKLYLEVAMGVGDVGRIYYAYVPPKLKEQVIAYLDGKVKSYDLSSVVIKRTATIPKLTMFEPDPIVELYFGHLGISSFNELMSHIITKHEELLTLYEDDEGRFYTADVRTIKGGREYVDEWIETCSNHMKVERKKIYGT